jgi:hypothetical protein
MMANLLLLGGDGAFPGQGRTGKNDRIKNSIAIGRKEASDQA